MSYSQNLKFTDKGIVFTDKHGRELSTDQAFHKIFNRFHNWILDFELFMLHLVSLHAPIYFLRKVVFEIAGVKIGRGSTIHMGCKFFDPRGVTMGEDTIIGDRAFLDGRDKLTIGNHVDIASEVMIYNSEHDIEDSDFKAITAPVEIGDYVFVGPRSIILPGVKIGSGAIVAAGAVVTKNVAEYEIVGGVPAKVISKRKNKDLRYRLGRARLFQ